MVSFGDPPGVTRRSACGTFDWAQAVSHGDPRGASKQATTIVQLLNLKAGILLTKSTVF